MEKDEVKKRLNGKFSTDPAFHAKFLTQIYNILEVPIEIHKGIRKFREMWIEEDTDLERIAILETIISACESSDVKERYKGSQRAVNAFNDIQRSNQLKQTLKNNGEQYERGSTEQYVAFIEFWIKYFLQEFPDDAKDLAIYEGTSGAKEAVMEMKNNEDDSLVKTASEKLRSVIAYYDTELFGVSEPLLL